MAVRLSRSSATWQHFSISGSPRAKKRLPLPRSDRTELPVRSIGIRNCTVTRREKIFYSFFCDATFLVRPFHPLLAFIRVLPGWVWETSCFETKNICTGCYTNSKDFCIEIEIFYIVMCAKRTPENSHTKKYHISPINPSFTFQIYQNQRVKSSRIIALGSRASFARHCHFSKVEKTRPHIHTDWIS